MTHAPIFRAATIVPRAADQADDATIEVVASTEAEDSFQSVLKQNWRLDRYLRNPVVLYAHESRELPIGTAEDVRVEGGTLRARIRFAEPGTTERVDQVRSLVRQKILRGVSVGFIPHDVRFEEHDGREVLVLDDLDLYELSICPVPSNPDALADLRARAVAATPPRPPMDKPAPGAPHDSSTPPPPEGKGAISDLHHQTYREHTMKAPGTVEGMSEEHREACRAAIGQHIDEARAMCTTDAGDRDASPSLCALLDVLGVVSLEDALPVASAAKRTAAQVEGLRARAVAAEEQLEAIERRGVLEQARTDGKLTPGQEQDGEYQAHLASMSVNQLRTHFRVLPVLVPRGTVKQPPKPGAKTPTVDVGERGWAQLSNNEKAQLYRENPELARSLKESAAKP